MSDESLIRLLFENSETALALVSPERVLLANAAAGDLLGLHEGDCAPGWGLFGAGEQRRGDRVVAYRMNAATWEGQAVRVLVGWDVTAVRAMAHEEHNKRTHRQRERQIAALGQLSSGLAHELNNALQVVQGGSELMAQEQPEQARPVLEATRRMANIVRHLMAFSGATVGEEDRVDVSGRLRSIDLHDFFGPDVDVATDIEERLRVRAIEGEVERIVRELLTNSMEAVGDVGYVSVVASSVLLKGDHAAMLGVASGEFVRIVVDDDGIGMSPSDVKRAAEPFFSTRGEDRAGLGLAAVQGIVARVGGAMQIESPGQGATVTVWLPAASAEPAATEERATLRGARVLLADDEPSVRELLTLMLQSQGAFVIACEDGLEALDASEREVFDALITDIKMPRMDGPTLAAELRRRRPTLPVLFITGFADSAVPPTVSDALVLNKPFDSEKLKDALARLLGRTATHSQSGSSRSKSSSSGS